MAIDRDKYRRLFIEEARESLRAFNNELVTLEKLSDQPSADGRAREAMDAAFRHAHSIKGMAAAMGQTRLAAVAHHMEDLASVARQGRSIGGPGFDLLLQGSDVLEGLVERVAQGEEDPDAGDIAARVAAYVATLAGDPEVMHAGASSTGAPGPAVAADLLAAATAVPAGPVGDSGETLIVTVRIADDASLPQVRAFVVHKALAMLAGWQKTEPPPETLKTRELVDRKLTLTFARTVAQPAEIERIARGAQGVADVTLVEGVPATAPPLDATPSGERSVERVQGGEDDRTVRVRTALLDEFIDSVGELLLARSRMRAMATRLELPELGDLVDEIDRLTRDLHGRVVAARMTPLSLMTERFPRVVRDLARKTQKAVDFQMLGTEIELDRAILDELAAPFLHMLRNAVDHGHEGAAARAAAGKAPAMHLSLRASRDRPVLRAESEGRRTETKPPRARTGARAQLASFARKGHAEEVASAKVVGHVCRN